MVVICHPQIPEKTAILACWLGHWALLLVNVCRPRAGELALTPARPIPEGNTAVRAAAVRTIPGFGRDCSVNSGQLLTERRPVAPHRVDGGIAAGVGEIAIGPAQGFDPGEIEHGRDMC